MPFSMSSGIARSNTVQPIGPRLTTISASGASSRIRRQAASVSVVPPAMWISSSVPTITSQSGTMVCRCAETLADRDEALLAQAMAGQAPEHRPVVDVEDHPAAVLLREPHRLPAHGVEVGLGEMRARDHDRARRRDVVLVDVVLGQRRHRRSSRGRRSKGRCAGRGCPRITSEVSRAGSVLTPLDVDALARRTAP